MTKELAIGHRISDISVFDLQNSSDHTRTKANLMMILPFIQNNSVSHTLKK